jgi:glyoxylase-like metal-dependent hydrolase (beta-lactamase superfamily II)
MATARVDIISIGTLSRNRLWNETTSVRTAHATTSLIRIAERNILIDPGLPAIALAARLHERVGLRPEQIDTIFLTNFRPSHRAGLAAFPNAKILLHENERDFCRRRLEAELAAAEPDEGDATTIHDTVRFLDSVESPQDKLAENVDLFPLFGYTPGTCGLLVSASLVTILIAGDAVATQDHFLAGQILPDSHDLAAARESLQEVYDIADLIVPGHDNIFLNPRMHGI